jgi:hypothetical protein
MRRVAIHEATHVIAGHVLGLPAATLARISPRGGELVRPHLNAMTVREIRGVISSASRPDLCWISPNTPITLLPAPVRDRVKDWLRAGHEEARKSSSSIAGRSSGSLERSSNTANSTVPLWPGCLREWKSRLTARCSL